MLPSGGVTEDEQILLEAWWIALLPKKLQLTVPPTPVHSAKLWPRSRQYDDVSTQDRQCAIELA